MRSSARTARTREPRRSSRRRFSKSEALEEPLLEVGVMLCGTYCVSFTVLHTLYVVQYRLSRVFLDFFGTREEPESNGVRGEPGLPLAEMRVEAAAAKVGHGMPCPYKNCGSLDTAG